MMDDEQVSGAVRALLERATVPMSDGWEAQAAQVMVRPRRSRRRIKRRLMAAAVGIAVTALALGLNPFRWSRHSPALDQALAAAAQVETVHAWGSLGEGKGAKTFEVWESRDGFRRYEVRTDGRLEFLELYDGKEERWYFAKDHQGLVRSDPPEYARLHTCWSETAGIGLLAAFHPFARLCPDMKVRERQEGGASGGRITVIEAEGKVTDREYHDAAYGTAYNGMPVRFHAEVEADTGSLISLEVWRGAGAVSHTDPESGERAAGPGLLDCLWQRFGTTWEPIYVTQGVEWGVPISEGVRAFAWPPGTLVHYDRWWETRGASELASAALPEGKLIVHALDVNERGDVFISVSRPGYRLATWWDSPAAQYPPDPEFEATDNAGQVYHRSDRLRDIEGPWRDYVLTALSSDARGTRPTSISLTIWPWSKKLPSHPPVVFRNLRLPPRQQGVDLRSEAREEERW